MAGPLGHNMTMNSQRVNANLSETSDERQTILGDSLFFGNIDEMHRPHRGGSEPKYDCYMYSRSRATLPKASERQTRV